MGSERLLDSIGDARQIAVERAQGEFRAARPVAILCGETALLALPLEGLTERLLLLLRQGKKAPRLIVPAARIAAKTSWDDPIASVALTPFTPDAIAA